MDTKDMFKEITGNCIAVRLRILDRAVTSIYNQALRPHGIKTTQMNIIVVVSAFGPMEIKPLCRVLNMDASTVNRALKRIEKKGWLKSQPSGQGKSLMVSSTSEGLSLLQRAYPDWKRAQNKAEELLGEEAVRVLCGAGDKMLLEGMTRYFP
ncbi:MAG: MarR family winged helix-turn-helix transcriptional regulator [Deltaproteobacteria bacterium]|nr:MarR family winged helix-turn-helix transcriptional regulator [Deltaproteobacteria bacterium]